MPTISPELLKLFNEQANVELTISNVYLQMSFWFEEQNYTGISKYLRKSSDEERGHGLSLYDYILKRNGVGTLVNLPEISNIVNKNTDALGIFENIYQLEMDNTDRLVKLANACIDMKDFRAYNFLEPLLKEQDDAENEILYIVDKLRQNIPDTLFFIDKEFQKA